MSCGVSLASARPLLSDRAPMLRTRARNRAHKAQQTSSALRTSMQSQGPATRAKHRSSRFQGLTKFRQSLRAAATACVACLFGCLLFVVFVFVCFWLALPWRLCLCLCSLSFVLFCFVVLCCSGNQDRRSSGCSLSPPAFGLSQADPHLPGCGDRPSRAEQTCMLEQSPPSMQHACIPWLVGWSGFGWCGWLSPTALLSLFQLARWSLEMANGYE